MKVSVSEDVVDFYTDVLAHSFEPEGGQRVAVGTTMGKITVMERDWENNEAFARMEVDVPNEAPVLGLTWGRAGVFVAAKNLLQLYSGNLHKEDYTLTKFDCIYDVQDVTVANPTGKVIGACEDCKVRVWDIETQKLLQELGDHKMPVQVCSANDEFLVSGGQDGQVHCYDAQLRTTKPVITFDQEKTTISGLDISRDSTWVAAGSSSSPYVYNLKNAAALPKVEVRDSQKIHTVHFDVTNTLWWGGGGATVFKSENLTSIAAEMKTAFGETTICHVYSISSTLPSRLSVAGSSTGILFSDNSDFWDGLVYV